MIISVHIRKCAGTTFKAALTQEFGPKIYMDYGDEVGSSWPSSKTKRLVKHSQMQAQRQALQKNYKIIHGHFYRSKFDFLTVPRDYITFMRDPVARVLSNYYYLKRNKNRKNGDALIVNALGFSLEEYVCHPDCQNLQSQYLQTEDLSEFKFVGLVEHYDASVAELNNQFGLSLPVGPSKNVNQTGSADYDISPETRDLILENNQKDQALYELAQQRMSSWTSAPEYA